MEIVGLMPLIQRLPKGLDTHLTSNGAPLTTSQLRRLMVARAIAGRPDIVLIDEVLDSLADSEAEKILRKIVADDQSSTVLVVTNRASLQSIMNTVVSLTSSSAEAAAKP
jgi:ABC-type transport system involved in cytochrome bd biosynthesis fused ATPase/permease subunit